MSRIAIVNYGMGNFYSIVRALQAAAPEHRAVLVNDAKSLRQADRIILPGQGAMPDCMQALHTSGLYDSLIQAAGNKPLLGICVGEQMLFDSSDEGPANCLGLMPGRVRRFAGPAFERTASRPPASSARPQPNGERPPLKIPHVGWNRVHQTQPHPLWHAIAQDTAFYFTHSYHARPQNATLVAGYADYGGPFCCAVAQRNLFAVQFHPEKSAAAGLQIYRNFASWQP